MRIVAALGGNALLERAEKPDADLQERHVTEAAAALAPLARDHSVIITHGNGPQVGMLALERDADPALTRPYPFDALVAETQGMIGYWLARALRDQVPDRDVGCLICMTRVDPADPAFANPTKFVGPGYDEYTARALAAGRGWTVRQDGSRWRRVVASPEPAELLELPLILALLAAGSLVICAGGGGIPVVRDAGGGLRGVSAVVDKDLTSALLAQATSADLLLILTDVPGVFNGFGAPGAQRIERATASQLLGDRLPAGSMGPKVDAACRFVAATGKTAAIGRLTDAEAICRGEAGTTVLPG
ncbi:MAG TPA: carbamate kinase [Streptosporangiaceae bacterium]|nr:carbamate kinase [Streptosporangiaceae bacterium]